MRLIGTLLLEEYYLLHADLKPRALSWIAEVKVARWRNPNDIRARYARASFLSDNRVIFPLGGNHYRLLARVTYDREVVNILKVGTHHEYDHWDL